MFAAPVTVKFVALAEVAVKFVEFNVGAVTVPVNVGFAVGAYAEIFTGEIL